MLQDGMTRLQSIVYEGFSSGGEDEHGTHSPTARPMGASSTHQGRRASLYQMERDDMKKGGGGATGAADTNSGMFADAGNLKEQAHENIDKPEYDVTMYYHETGFAQLIARNHFFGNLTLAMITLNAVWIGIDTELNTADNLTQAEWQFQAGEYLFVAFFLFEWLCRFGAFRTKTDGLKDKWFCFDTFLVTLMMFETFILPYAFPAQETTAAPAVGARNATVGSEAAGSTNLSQLSMLRMLRLLRLTRMVRLMRAVPELVTLLRSMTIALRSVISTLALLIIMMYVFAIVFKSQLKVDRDYEHQKFLIQKLGRVPDAMWTLLLTGTFLDGISLTANRLLEQSFGLTVVLALFVMMSSFTILNMLVGLLCEVVDAVASAEKEKGMVSYVKTKLMDVLERLDEDGNGTISRDEFDQLLTIPEAVTALTELGVDVHNLVSLSDHLFQSEDIGEDMEYKGTESMVDNPNSQLSFLRSDTEAANATGEDEEEEEEEEEVSMSNTEFIEMVIRLRSTNQPSVLDIVDLRKLILKSQTSMMAKLDVLEEAQLGLISQIHLINDTIEYLSSKDRLATLVEVCSQPLPSKNSPKNRTQAKF